MNALPWGQEASALIERIDELLESDKFGWAEDTLLGIRETVMRTETCTAGQQQAVENIAAKRGY